MFCGTITDNGRSGAMANGKIKPALKRRLIFVPLLNSVPDMTDPHRLIDNNTQDNEPHKGLVTADRVAILHTEEVIEVAVDDVVRGRFRKKSSSTAMIKDTFEGSLPCP